MCLSIHVFELGGTNAGKCSTGSISNTHIPWWDPPPAKFPMEATSNIYSSVSVQVFWRNLDFSDIGGARTREVSHQWGGDMGHLHAKSWEQMLLKHSAYFF